MHSFRMSTTCASAALTVDVLFAFATVFGGGGAFFAGAAFFGGAFFGGDFFAAFGGGFFVSSGCSHTAVGLVTRPLPLDRSESAEGTTLTSFFFTIGDLTAFGAAFAAAFGAAFAGSAFLGGTLGGGAFLAGGAGFGGGDFFAGAAFAGGAFFAIVFFGYDVCVTRASGNPRPASGVHMCARAV